MNFFVLLTIVSAICSIVGLVFELYIAKYSKAKKWLWGLAVFALTFISGLAIHYNSENERIKNIHRQAKNISDCYDSVWPADYINEALTFLEENRDRYPDSYERGKQHEYNNSDQIQRSGTSIGANYSEACNAVSTADFVNKLAIAQKEAHETIYWLRVLYGSELISKEQYDDLMTDVQSLHKILSASVATLKNKD